MNSILLPTVRSQQQADAQMLLQSEGFGLCVAQQSPQGVEMSEKTLNLSALQRNKYMPGTEVLVSQCRGCREPAAISFFGLAFSGLRAAKRFVQFVCMYVCMPRLLFFSFFLLMVWRLDCSHLCHCHKSGFPSCLSAVLVVLAAATKILLIKNTFSSPSYIGIILLKLG